MSIRNNLNIKNDEFSIKYYIISSYSKTAWPSGLRRQIKALFRKGEGSNPSAVNFVNFVILQIFVFYISIIRSIIIEFNKKQ